MISSHWRRHRHIIIIIIIVRWSLIKWHVSLNHWTNSRHKDGVARCEDTMGGARRWLTAGAWHDYLSQKSPPVLLQQQSPWHCHSRQKDEDADSITLRRSSWSVQIVMKHCRVFSCLCHQGFERFSDKVDKVFEASTARERQPWICLHRQTNFATRHWLIWSVILWNSAWYYLQLFRTTKLNDRT